MASNAYNDAERAAAYATLEFPGTYYLAFRDLPGILAANAGGRRALDFGCGAGRSSRFLKRQGFEVTGVDVSASMVAAARSADPLGHYLLIEDGDFSAFSPGSFDLIFSAFAFDNIPGIAWRTHLLHGLRALLKAGGRIVLVDSAPEIYTREWASFTTRDFPENRNAGSGEEVRIVMTDVADRRPIVDFFWSQQDYTQLFHAAGLAVLACHRPLGRKDEGQPWISELTVSPWMIYVLRAAPLAPFGSGCTASGLQK